jgi:hypothetical protein
MEIIPVETADSKHSSNDKDLGLDYPGKMYHDKQQQGIRDESVNCKHGYHDGTIISFSSRASN